MRQKRAKTYRKLLRTYIQHFSFREPYQILLDDSFLLTLSKHKINNPLKRITDLIQTSKDAKLMITQCSIVALYKREKEGTEFKEAVEMAKGAERRKCNHREPIEVEDCIKSVVGTSNQHRYILATDSASIRHHLRNNVLGVPVIHNNERGVMVMEPMSELTQTRIEQLELRKLSATKSEASILGTGNAQDMENVVGSTSTKTDPVEGNEGPVFKKRKVKEPNPLSMKKSKKQKEKEAKEKAELQKQKNKGKGKEKVKEGGSLKGVGEVKQKVGEKRKRDGDEDLKSHGSVKEDGKKEVGKGSDTVVGGEGEGEGGETKSSGTKKRRKRGKGGSKGSGEVVVQES